MPKVARRIFLSSGSGLATALLASGFDSPASMTTQITAPHTGEHASATAAFLAAVIAGDVKAVNAFLEEDDALLYARDRDGQSAYLLAAYAGRTEVIKVFENRNIVLDVYEAAATARLERLKTLLKGCPGLLRGSNPAGDTPLHVAARTGQSIAIENIIGYGPDFSIVNPLRGNVTAAHLALQCPDADAAEAMTFAIIGNGADPNAVTADGDTVLGCAARAGNVRVIKLILQKGGDTTARNKSGNTAAEIAQSATHVEAKQLLDKPELIARDY